MLTAKFMNRIADFGPTLAILLILLILVFPTGTTPAATNKANAGTALDTITLTTNAPTGRNDDPTFWYPLIWQVGAVVWVVRRRTPIPIYMAVNLMMVLLWSRLVKAVGVVTAAIRPLILGLSLTLTITGSLMIWPAGQVQAGSGLPPRNTPASRDAGETDETNHDDSNPAGAYIEFQVAPTLGGKWSQVEWQDSQGNWYPVDGWAGSLDGQGQRRWWVDAKDFGRGPFRWLVKQGIDGPVIHTSQSFSLPAGIGQTVQIVIE